MNVGAGASELPVKKKYEPLNEGKYTVTLTRAEEKATKKGNGSYIDATFEVKEGDSAGRLIFERFLIDHPSAIAVDIGKKQLDRLLRASGLANGAEGINYDYTQLESIFNKLVVADVKIEPASAYFKDGKEVMGNARNKITGFYVR